MLERLTLYSDGGARGNPGPAAIAFIALSDAERVIKADSRFIGEATNNQAEYRALIAALEFAASIKAQEVTCNLDSELVGKQLKGEYSVKNPELQKLWRKAKELSRDFKKIRFVNVPRSNMHISRADELVNRVLDEEERKVSRTKDHNKPSNKKLEAKTMFVHASIRTSNVERSIDFYTQLLGLKVLSRREIKQTNSEIVFLQDPKGEGCTLELTFYRDQKKFTQPEYEERLFDHLGFTVSNINQTLAAMRKENVTVTDEPFKLGPNGPTIAFVEDPDGTLIELIES